MQVYTIVINTYFGVSVAINTAVLIFWAFTFYELGKLVYIATPIF